jgi:hypothetical protein
LGIRKPPAFILGLGVNGYGVVRSLARAGVGMVGFHSAPEELGRFSRYCESHYLAPSLNDDEICEALIERGRHADGKPVLFPTTDYHAPADQMDEGLLQARPVERALSAFGARAQIVAVENGTARLES